MIYATEEKRELDSILAAFGDYIRAHSYFDIVYSEKIGYIQIRLEEEELVVIRSADELLELLFSEVVNDVLFGGDAGECESSELSEKDAEEVRRRIAELLSAAGSGADGYLKFLNEYLEAYPDDDFEE